MGSMICVPSYGRAIGCFFCLLGQAGTFWAEIDCRVLDATQRVYLVSNLLPKVLYLLHLLSDSGRFCSSARRQESRRGFVEVMQGSVTIYLI